MQKYSAFDICKAMGGGVCEHCGIYDTVQPCNQLVPRYIPEEQIERFIRLKEERNEKPSH